MKKLLLAVLLCGGCTTIQTPDLQVGSLFGKRSFESLTYTNTNGTSIHVEGYKNDQDKALLVLQKALEAYMKSVK